MIANNRFTLLNAIWTGCCVAALVVGIATQQRARSGEPRESGPVSRGPLALASLPCAYRLHTKVISGGRPSGEAGFQTLKRLGVKTVISVDAAKPELSLARRYGLRYVHLPHGYDGISARRSLELAVAVYHLPGRIYIHCHHGQHRSPAAAVVACISAGLLTREQGYQVLSRVGTSPEYRGLHKAVLNAQRYQDLNNHNVVFRDTVEVPPLATAMVEIERTFDNLVQIQRSGWRSPPSRPDHTAPHEALLLREHFTELVRTDDTQFRPSRYRELLKQTLAHAELLEQLTRASSTDRVPTVQRRRRLSASLAAISNDCKRCHREHRDALSANE